MPSPSRTPEEAHAAIQKFLQTSKRPALLEPGEEQILLTAENHVLELHGGRLRVQAWDERRNITRRVTDIKTEQPGRLELAVERFGKQTGTLELLDLARPRGQQATRRGERLTYREHFRRSLSRQFPGWSIRDLSSDPDLEHSLSPAYPRALLVKGSTGLAAIGAARDSLDPAGALTFGLIWLDYLRTRERRLGIEALLVFIPTGHERGVSLRVLHFNPAVAQYRVFAYDDSYEGEIDVDDHGNIDTEVVPRQAPGPEAACDANTLLGELARIPDVDIIENNDQSHSLRVRGLEIARRCGSELRFGLETKHIAKASNLGEIAALTREVARMRSAAARDRHNELYLRNPESWLESQVRAHVEEIDASLLPSPIYGQVPAIAGLDRGLIDLLAADRRGRLTILELKASEDPHLPLQALDYWIRVNWHRQQDEFARNGYFPGVALANEPPRMLLIAPALEFHPTSDRVLSFFSPAIEVERVGLSMEWRADIKVMFRMKGANTQ